MIAREQWILLFSICGAAIGVLVLYLALRIKDGISEVDAKVTKLQDRAAGELTKQALEEEHKATRSHISNELDSVRGAMQGTQSNSRYVVDLMKKLSKVFGVNPP